MTPTDAGYLMGRYVGQPSYAYLPVVKSRNPEEKLAIQKLFDENVAHEGLHAHPQARKYYDMAYDSSLRNDVASAAYSTLIMESTPVDGSAPGKTIMLAGMLSQPLSRGNVHIASSNPTDAPLIDPNYFSCEVDLEIFARHIQYLETIAQLEPFRSEISKIQGSSEPAVYFGDLEVAKEYIRRTARTMWHLCGTCSMLPREKGGVVDARLVVFGTSNLRIVDASVIPLISAANILATVYAVAERAAALIEEDHGLIV